MSSVVIAGLLRSGGRCSPTLNRNRDGPAVDNRLAAARLSAVAAASRLPTATGEAKTPTPPQGTQPEDLFEVGLEGVAVDGAGEHEGGDHAVARDPGNEGGCVPVSVRHGHAQAFASRGPSMGAGHVGLGPGLVDEHQPFGVETGLAVPPGAPLGQHVRAVLLRRVAGLFFA